MSDAPPTPEPVIARQAIPLANLDPDAVKVVRRIVRHGHEAFLVGGCVRDLLLGCQPKDFDVATSARPTELKKLFRNCRIIGRRFRLAHMLFRDGKIIEVATFRSDPGGNADDLLLRRDNVFGEPHEDALRRDFTINGLFYDVMRRQIIDYVEGLDDIERRVVRTIGDPNIRLQEDPVRVIRAIKFTARQDLGLDPELYSASLRYRSLLARISPARLFEELLRLLRGGAAHRSIWLAQEMGVIDELIPELAQVLRSGCDEAHLVYDALQAIDVMHKHDRLPCDAVLLTALLEQPLRLRITGSHDVGRSLRDALRPIAERMIMPRRIRDQIRQLLIEVRRLTGESKRRRSPRLRADLAQELAELWEIKLRVRGADDNEIDSQRKRLSRAATRAPRKRPQTRRRRRPRRHN